ncbi:MAG: hypothetical protein LUH82_04260 [Clostridiales bacterium]|nr:hypothetical protein [Clostridiales bacterium]
MPEILSNGALACFLPPVCLSQRNAKHYLFFLVSGALQFGLRIFWQVKAKGFSKAAAL